MRKERRSKTGKEGPQGHDCMSEDRTEDGIKLSRKEGHGAKESI